MVCGPQGDDLFYPAVMPTRPGFGLKALSAFSSDPTCVDSVNMARRIHISKARKGAAARKAVRRGRQAIRVDAAVVAWSRWDHTVERVAGMTRAFAGWYARPEKD